MDDLVQWLGAYLSDYGYWALFFLFFVGLIGLPVPEETLLVVSGFFVSTGQLSYLPVLAVCYFGSVSAMTAAYWIGRGLGYTFVRKVGKRLGSNLSWYHKTEEWFARVGKWALPIGYFIPGVRQWTAYVAGITRLPFRTFAVFAYTGGLFWSGLFVTLGWQLGERWEQLFEGISRNLAVVFLLALGLIVGASLLQRRMRMGKRVRQHVTKPKEEGSQ